MQNQQDTRPGPARIRAVEATSGGLIRSTLAAGAAALAVLTIVYLPAEYGTDPTGLGSVLGLTEMGAIKQQLYAEDAAEAADPVDVELVARLERIETQLAGLAEVMRTTAPVSAAPTAEAIVPEVEAAVAEAVAASDWRDEVSYSLPPGEGIEVKLAMEEGQTARFEWTANGSVVNYDTHGDGGGQKVSYEQGRATPGQAGELTAAFTGNHGWFWRNRTDAPVTVTLRTAGDYSALKAP